MKHTQLKHIYLFILGFLLLASCRNAPEKQTRAPATMVSTATNTQTYTPAATYTFTPPPTATYTQTPAATATNTATPTPTATATPSPTPTPVGGQMRAYNQRYIYLDDGHEEPDSIRLPANKLILPGHAYFPAWSPDYLWLASLQSSLPFSQNEIREKRIALRRVTLYITKTDGSETRELAELTYPDISNCIMTEIGACDGTGARHIYQGNFVVWSPDGARLAYLNYLDRSNTSNKPIRFEIMVVSITGGEPVKVGETTFAWNDTAFDMRPLAWSPDGSQIAYTSYGNEDYGLHIVNADGSGSRRVLAMRYLSLPYWSNDGQSILLQQAQRLPSVKWQINGAWYASFMTNSGQLVQVNKDGFNFKIIADNAQDPVLSPDGTMVAYVAGGQIKVLTLADRYEQVIASVCGYGVPEGGSYRLRWSPDSQAIAFQTRKIFERNGQPRCEFSNTRYVGIYSAPGEQIAMIAYYTLMVDEPSFAFSPDSRWLAVTQGVIRGAEPTILLVDLLDGTAISTRIASPFEGVLVWQTKY